MHYETKFVGCSQEEQRELQDDWEVEQERLQSKLNELDETAQLLALQVEHDNDEGDWSVQLQVGFATRTAEAFHEGEHPRQLLKQAAAEVLNQLDRWHRRQTSQRIRGQQLDLLRPVLESLYETGKRTQFFERLTGAVESFRGQVRRDLELSEQDGDASTGTADVDEVLSEARLQAWDRFSQINNGIPLGEWLTSLVDEARTGLLQMRTDASLDSAAPPERGSIPDVEQQSDTWIDQPWDTEITFAETFAGDLGMSYWDQLSLPEQQSRFVRIISELPRLQRQSIVLSAVEGYEPQQIADLQDRPLDLVMEDLEATRAALRKNLTTFEEDDWEDVQEQIERPGGRDRSRRRR